MITSVPDWQTKTAEECRAWLLETETTRDSQTVVVQTLITRLGRDNARVVLGTLRAVAEQDPLVASALSALQTVGISLDDDLRQGMIDEIGAVAEWSAELTSAVKAIGRPVVARWVSAGYASEPTLDQVAKEKIVAATRAAMADVLRPVVAKANALNAWLDVLDTSAMTPDEVAAYCDGLLASEDGNPQ